MITLYHYYLCSSSRYIRLILEEQKIKYETQLENYWKPQKDFLKLNSTGNLPVLVNEENFPDASRQEVVNEIIDVWHELRAIREQFDDEQYFFTKEEQQNFELDKIEQ